MPIRPRKKSAAPPAPRPTEADLAAEVAALRVEMQRINAHRYVRAHNSYFRLFGLQLVKGLALGLGTVLGASILVSVVAYFLSQIELLPIIGEWASEIIKQIEEQKPR